jgi:hypothetical membrane protein
LKRLLAAGGLVGPAAFITAWAVLGARTAGYSPTQDAISNLAAVHAPTRTAMTAGFAAFGIGVPCYSLALRSALPGRSWISAATTGVATLGVAAFPLGSSSAADFTHGAFATLGYATLAATPLVASRALARQGRQRWVVPSTLAGVASGACLVATVGGRYHGLLQRAGLTIGDAWLMATALWLLRRDQS